MTASDPTTAEARAAQDGYALVVCSCEDGPYLGARKAGTPCCCEVCEFITQDQLDAILAARLAPASGLAAAVEALQTEVDHWKAHAEEAGRGFTQVCKDAARFSARNVALVEECDRLRAALAATPAEADGACPACGADSRFCCLYAYAAHTAPVPDQQAVAQAIRDHRLQPRFRSGEAAPSMDYECLCGDLFMGVAEWSEHVANAVALATGQGPDTGGESE